MTRSGTGLSALLLAMALAVAAARPVDAADRLFIASDQRNYLTVIDPSTQGSAVIELADGLHAEAVSTGEDGRFVFISSRRKNTMFVFDAMSREIVETLESVFDQLRFEGHVIQSGGAPGRVRRYGEEAIGLLDRDGRRLIATFPYETGIYAYDPVANRLYAASSDYNKVVLAFDPGSGAATQRITTTDIPRELFLSGDGQRLYVIHDDSISIIDAQSGATSLSIRINGHIDRVLIPPKGSLAHVFTQGSGVLTVVDLNLGRPVNFLRLASNLAGLAVSDDGLRFYLSVADSIVVVDSRSGTILRNIPVSTQGDVVLAADETRAFVLNRWLDSALIDLEKGEVMRRIPAVPLLLDYALAAGGLELYAVFEPGYGVPDSLLQIIDARSGQILKEFRDDPPDHVRSAPDGQVYVTQPASGVVTVIDAATATIRAEIPPLQRGDGTRRLPVDVAFSPDGEHAYVTYKSVPSDSYSGAIGVYRAADQTLEWSIAWPEDTWPYDWGAGAPSHIAVTPDGREAYFVMDSNHVGVLDTASRTTTDMIPVGISDDWITDVTMAPDGSRVFFTRWEQPADNDVALLAVIDTATKKARQLYLPGNGAAGVVALADGMRIFATTSGFDTSCDRAELAGQIVSVIDLATESLVSHLHISREWPWRLGGFVAASADSQRVYVTQTELGTVTTIDASTNTLVEAIAAGDLPERIAVVSADNLVPLPTSVATSTPTSGQATPALPQPGTVAAPILVLHDEQVSYVGEDGARLLPLRGFAQDVVAAPEHDTGYAVTHLEWQDDRVENLIWRITGKATEQIAGFRLTSTAKKIVPAADGSLLYIAGWRWNGNPWQETYAYGALTDVIVLELDGSARRTIATLAGYPCAMQSSPEGAEMYVVTSYPSETFVTTVDTATHKPLSTLTLNGSCEDAKLSPDGSRLIVRGHDAEINAGRITIVDVQMLAIESTLAAPDLPGTFAWNESGESAYFAGDRPLLLATLDVASARIVDDMPLPHYVFEMDAVVGSEYIYASTPEGILEIDPTRKQYVGRASAPMGKIAALCRHPSCRSASPPKGRTPIAVLPHDTPRQLPEPSPTPSPIPAPIWIRADDLVTPPGVRAEVSVTLFGGDFIHATNNDLVFPAGVTIATWIDDQPDCDAFPTPVRMYGLPEIEFTFLPTGCRPGRDCSGVRAQMVPTEYYGLWYTHIIYRCRIEIDPGLPPGVHSMAVANASAWREYIDGGRSILPVLPIDGRLTIVGEGTNEPTSTPTASSTPPSSFTATDPQSTFTPTPTATRTIPAADPPSATPAHTISLQVVAQPAVVGGSFEFSVRLVAGLAQVVGLQNDVDVDRLDVRRCRVNREIGKAGYFGFYAGPDGAGTPRCPEGVRCDRVRAIIVPYEDLEPIPDGSILYTCTGDVPATAAPGSYQLVVGSVIGAGPNGERLEGIGSVGVADVELERQAFHKAKVGANGRRDNGGCSVRANGGGASAPIVWLSLAAALGRLFSRGRRSICGNRA